MDPTTIEFDAFQFYLLTIFFVWWGFRIFRKKRLCVRFVLCLFATVFSAFLCVVNMYLYSFGVYMVTFQSEPGSVSNFVSSDHKGKLTKPNHFLFLRVQSPNSEGSRIFKTQQLQKEYQNKGYKNVLINLEDIQDIPFPFISQAVPVDLNKGLSESRSQSIQNAITVAKRFVPESTDLDIYEDDPKNKGNSAGLMMALELIHQFGDKDLIGDKKIAGTGSIDEYGNVGTIGSLDLKLLSADQANVEYCLVSQKDYELGKEVVNKYHLKLKLLPVNNINQALDMLDSIQGY